MEISTTLKHIQPNSNLFSNNWCNFHIDKVTGRLVKDQLKMLGMVQKKLYRTTLIRFGNLDDLWLDPLKNSELISFQLKYPCLALQVIIFGEFEERGD